MLATYMYVIPLKRGANSIFSLSSSKKYML